MAQILAENARSRCPGVCMLLLCASTLFGTWLAGCNNTCFTFTSNPPTGTINVKAGDPKPACTLTRANGAIRLVMQTIPICSSCSESAQIRHVFVSIRGIDIHASSTADDDSPEWQELAPQLAKQPLQVDLIKGGADQDMREPLGEIVAIPAGTYRQVRVRFTGTLPATDEVTAKIACGGAGFNCAVMEDGTIQPLLFDTACPELRITSERIVDGFFLVLPDVDSELVIEMTPVWSWFASANGGVRLLPALTGNAKLERVEFRELGAPAGDIARVPQSR